MACANSPYSSRIHPFHDDADMKRRADLIAETIVRISKRVARRFGLMTGGSKGEDDWRVIFPTEWCGTNGDWNQQ